ncbi:hypothetical protein DMN91_006290 [Ooceraea biroi]|uniref:Uncharacterized protein n=1 Tax=Ooceraea biroi TaxID=2015173 RepID=A0A026W1F7_OOCBI|nr:uncharacterized protein LOC105285144 [Ooceraea biroi]EZA48894.1 hypothetical protein X777_12936 [Ooceraea biroi]RLU21911.1 hypothetical protein DMN91_006290 [Ooceraea biroi]
MPFNGVRVLPDILIDMPNLENLIREFEKGLTSTSEGRKNVASQSPTSSNGRIVKKIVEAYELRAIENAQRKQAERRSSFVNTLGNACNRRTFGGSTPTIHHKSADSSQKRDSLDKNFRVFSVPNIDTQVRDEIDSVATNQYHLNAKEKKALVWRKVLPNLYDSKNERTKMRLNSPKKSENLNKRDRIFCTPSKSERGNKSKAKCRSSPLLDNEDKDKDCGDLLYDILTNSCTSSNSSNSSYKNLRINLYEGDEWQRKSSTSLQKSSSLCDEATSDTSRTNDSSLLDLSFQSTSKDTITSGDVSNDLSNFQSAEPIMRLSGVSNHNQKPRVVGAFLKLPMRINNTNVTWIPTLNGKLPRKNSLKKLISVFTNRRKRMEKQSKKYSKKQQRTYDLESEQCSSSSSSRKSWYSEPDTSIDRPSISPTFETFGRTYRPDLYHANRTNKSRIVLTELPREDLTTDLGSSKLTSQIPVVSVDHVSSSSQVNRRNVDPTSETATVASSPRSKMSYEHLSLPKHHLSQNKVFKHPFVAQTKLDQLNEKTTATMKKDVKQKAKIKKKSDASELESSIASSVFASSSMSTSLNISSPRVSEWVASSPNNIYDVPRRSNASKSMNALNEILPQVPQIYDIPRSKSDQFTSRSPTVNVRSKTYPRYATISLKNLRRLLSQEKLQTLGNSIDV